MHRLVLVLLLIVLYGSTISHGSSVVKVKTRKLSSVNGLPYRFYDGFKFCRPKRITGEVESISEALFGDRIENSIFNFEFRPTENIKCSLIAEGNIDIYNRPSKDSKSQIDCPEIKNSDYKQLVNLIKNNYNVQLLVDNLPFANRQAESDCGNLPTFSSSGVFLKTNRYRSPDGFPLGCSIPGNNNQFILNNHWSFILKYHHEKNGKKSIVGAEVIPSSIDHNKIPNHQCRPDRSLPSSIPTNQKFIVDEKSNRNSIPWSFSLQWEESDIKWASRWDAYANVEESDTYTVHWFSIINSVMIVLILTGMIAMIMARILGRDIKRYDENEDDESGWKLLHGDVFRPPFASSLLSIFYGSGIQIMGMAFVTLIFAVMGLSNPSNRSSLATVMILLFAAMGILGGYNALRCYKMMNGTMWKTVTFLTATLFPAIMLLIYSALNIIVWLGSNSSSAVPFLTLFKIFLVWIGVSTPLVFVGAYFGYKQEKISNPTEVNTIPRFIPSQPWYLSTPITIIAGGILPFGAAFIEIYFIMGSIWLHKYYFVFGFLLFVFFILLITSAEISIVLIYFQLSQENYRWWWRSFFVSGSSAFYLLFYSAFYFFAKIHGRTFFMTLVFFEYMGMISWLFFLMTGSAGFLASLWFLRKIYSQVKVS